MANRYFSNAGHFYVPHVMPVLVDCSFVIAAGVATGVSGLKGQVASVSSYNTIDSTPPEAGYFKVSLSDPYYKYFGGFSQFIAPPTGNVAIASRAANRTYVIRSLGTTTAAQWITAGLPIGVTAAVGVSFQAAGTGGSLGTGTLSTPAVSGVSGIELVGDPQLGPALAPVGTGAASPYIWFKFVGATSSSVTTPIAVQPVDGTIVKLAMYFGNSSVLVAGE